MKTIFQAESAKELIARIQQLTPNTRRLWGKMDVAQMLTHCSEGIRMALGEIQMRPTLLGLLFGRFFKGMLTDSKPFQKNGPTASELVVADVREFEAEKERLISYIQKLHDGGEVALTQQRHPFFGKLSSEEWASLMYKHLNHHLQQFGV